MIFGLLFRKDLGSFGSQSRAAGLPLKLLDNLRRQTSDNL